MIEWSQDFSYFSPVRKTKPFSIIEETPIIPTITDRSSQVSSESTHTNPRRPAFRKADVDAHEEPESRIIIFAGEGPHGDGVAVDAGVFPRRSLLPRDRAAAEKGVNVNLVRRLRSSPRHRLPRQ